MSQGLPKSLSGVYKASRILLFYREPSEFFYSLQVPLGVSLVSIRTHRSLPNLYRKFNVVYNGPRSLSIASIMILLYRDSFYTLWGHGSLPTHCGDPKSLSILYKEP